jgi:hypothetical protein
MVESFVSLSGAAEEDCVDEVIEMLMDLSLGEGKI